MEGEEEVRDTPFEILDAFADTILFVIAAITSPVWFPLWAFRRWRKEVA